MLGLIDAAALQLPETFTAAARAADDAGAFHDAQVFADGLTGDAGAGGEAGDGHRAAVAVAGDQQQARVVSQGGEERRWVPCVGARLIMPSGMEASRAKFSREGKESTEE